MSRELHILILDHATTDALRVQQELHKFEIEITFRREETRDGFIRALSEFVPDVVISNYGASNFDGLSALRIVRQQSPGTPFIFTSSVSGEEIAIEAVKSGASDYVLKTNLKRLGPAVLRALRERDEYLELRESGERNLTILHAAMDGFWLTNVRGRLLQVNQTYCHMSGYSELELLAMHIADLEAAESAQDIEAHAKEVMRVGSARFESRHRRKDGSLFDVEIAVQFSAVRGGCFVCFLRDITARKRAELSLREHVLRIERTVSATVGAITRITDFRDPNTSGHERRVGEIAASIGAELSLDTEAQRGLRVAGALHDVGKASIPAELLSKPGKLSTLELEMIRTHPDLGYEVLKDIDFPWPVAEVARQHHERLDGSGYPRGLKREEILLEARIIAVADVVEAMASHRPYRAGHGVEKAIAEIERGSGIAYDEQSVSACVRLFRDKEFTIPD